MAISKNNENQCNFRINTELKKLAENKAAKYGMTLAEYLRFLIMEDIRKEK